MIKLNTIFSYVKEGKLFYGIEYFKSSDTSVVLYKLVIAKKNKEELDILSSQSLEEWDAVGKQVPKGSQVFLILNSTDVVVKAIENNRLGRTSQINDLFPNINLNEFYYELVKTDKNVIVAICRKEVIQKHIKKLKEQDLFVTGWSFNKMSIASLPLENIEELLNKNIENKKIEIGDQEIAEKYLPVFSGIFINASKNRTAETNFDDEESLYINDFLQNRFFKLALPSCVVLILVLLIANFLIFNSYFQKVENFRELVEINHSQKNFIVNLKNEVESKKQMVADVQQSSGSRVGFYIDHIAASLNEEILLEDLNYQPVEKIIKADQAVTLKSNIIEISGKTNDNQKLSQWISVLEKFEFIKNVKIVDLQHDEDNYSIFTLKLNLKI